MDKRESLPSELIRLLAASEPKARDDAWAAFTKAYSKLILHVTRQPGGSYDPSMDRYAYVLEQLRRDDFRRLRGYAADGRSKFTTWLVVVTRRLCLDHDRHRYGRQRTSSSTATPVDTNTPADPSASDAAAARRRLVDLLGEEVDVERLASSSNDDPETELRVGELHRALESELAGLAPADRLLLKLRFEEELTAGQISRLLDLPTPFHVYRRLNHVLEGLRRSLRRRGIQEASP